MIRVQTSSTANTIATVNMRRLDRGLKLALDYTLTVMALLLIAPLLILIAVLIKAESPGPALYRVRVVGRHGREFNAFKFRTMFVNGNARLIADRNQWLKVMDGKVDDDPRLTRVGRFLRRYGLDELPRLFNVLNRTMSLVGPRMMTRTEMFKFGHRIQGYTDVLPGMTGLWQVSGHSSRANERVELETRYIRDRSFLLDVQILFRSVLVAFAE